MITISNVHKTFDGQHVLRGVDLSINEGELIAIIGKSGGGKSVLLKNIIGLQKPDSGSISFDGVDITSIDLRQLNKVRERFGVLFQSGALFDSMTVYNNIAFPLRERYKLHESEIRERVTGALGEVGLMDVDNKYPAELSGGMKKRAALARALVTKPQVVFFDEPTTGLDPVLKDSIHRLIKQCHTNIGFTGIIISHEIPDIFSVADRVAMLHEGVIVQDGSPTDIINSQLPSVREFVHAGSY
ncbi:ABC transporter ATP-binding protein [Candidatus Magnetobacterium casense]|uniref:ABC transporter ATP-binding protein n=1 Tax=Candidatus Magnetobacterium casense TaxID=1455061 RepID=A0ABS6RX10_9BACT|nr:ABC transporter ATP-binding protein [Candidatus Magnetobacterium casensis]MBV6340793.1 ABC transporter ATP-binding protein [Candidatus Magnetobacterium casensis]